MQYVKKLFFVLLVLSMYTLSWFVSSEYSYDVEKWITGFENHLLIIHVLWVFFAIIVVPLPAFICIPEMVLIFGPTLTAVTTAISMACAGIACMYIASLKGEQVARLFFSEEELSSVRERLHKRVVCDTDVTGAYTRILHTYVKYHLLIPLQIIAYTLGLANMSLRERFLYFVGSLIGIAPFIFVLSYTTAYGHHWETVLAWSVYVAIIIMAWRQSIFACIMGHYRTS